MTFCFPYFTQTTPHNLVLIIRQQIFFFSCVKEHHFQKDDFSHTVIFIYTLSRMLVSCRVTCHISLNILLKVFPTISSIFLWAHPQLQVFFTPLPTALSSPTLSTNDERSLFPSSLKSGQQPTGGTPPFKGILLPAIKMVTHFPLQEHEKAATVPQTRQKHQAKCDLQNLDVREESLHTPNSERNHIKIQTLDLHFNTILLKGSKVSNNKVYNHNTSTKVWGK